MVLTREYNALLTLVKAGLWHKIITDCSLFPLTNLEWYSVLELAHKQTVTGLLYRGLDYLPDQHLPPYDFMLQLVAEIDKIENINKKVNDTVLSLFHLFKKHDLHPILQKGQGAATMYIDPLLRIPGDIDLFFPNKDEHKKALEILTEQNVSFEKMPDGAISYKWNDIDVEHHTKLLDIHSPFAIRRLDKVLDYTKASKVSIGSSPENTIDIPSPKQNLLLMTSHILKHAIGHGIGLRQLCDLARACHELRNEVGANEIKEIYSVAGISKWANLLYSFMTEWLGLPENANPYKEQNKDLRTTELMNIIISGGNFGQYNRKKSYGSIWKRKLQTFTSFCSHARFSLSIAWQETVWTTLSLVKGQLNGEG